MLNRVFDKMEENSVGKGAKGFGKRIVCPPPQMVQKVFKKIVLKNLQIFTQRFKTFRCHESVQKNLATKISESHANH